MQFDWRRHWSKKVAPHLGKEVVQVALDLGMSLLDPGWCRGDAPWVLGAIPSTWTRVVTGKLTWYQVWGRCHWIAFFSMAVGVLNYPDLDWRFVSGDLHTVGYGEDGKPKVVMDILLFDDMSAEVSIAHASKKLDGGPNDGGLDEAFEFFVKTWVPRIRNAALMTVCDNEGEKPVACTTSEPGAAEAGRSRDCLTGGRRDM